MQPEKAATPATACFGLAMQANVAPAGVVNDSETTLVSWTAVAPVASCTVTVGCVAKSRPPVAPRGCVLKASFVAAGTGAVATMPTMLACSANAPAEPKKPASPNEKTPPSAATNQ